MLNANKGRFILFVFFGSIFINAMATSLATRHCPEMVAAYFEESKEYVTEDQLQFMKYFL